MIIEEVGLDRSRVSDSSIVKILLSLDQNRNIKPINGFPEHFISDNGNIYSTTRESKGKRRFLLTKIKPSIHRGYSRVTLKRNGSVKYYSVHRLVCSHFKGVGGLGAQVNHIDGNKSNNTVNNLEWCTPKENIKHAFDSGLMLRKMGENNNTSKITRAQCLEILNSPDDINAIKKLSNNFNITFGHIRKIKNRQAWARI